MEELIKFALLSNQLNDEEYTQFIAKSIKLRGRNFFDALLFNHFKNTNTGASNESINSFSNIIKQIIESRKTKPLEQISCNKLDELPCELISECSSFLNATQYFEFGKVSRTIYTSIYSPPKIYEFPFYLFKKHPPTMTMKRFKNVTNLEIDLHIFNHALSTTNQLMWQTNNIKKLMIDARYENSDYTKQQLHQFIKSINLDNITDLDFDVCVEYDIAQFINLLSQFSNLKYLHLISEAWIMNNNDINDTIGLALPQLRGISFECNEDHNDNTKLMSIFSHQLEELCIEYACSDVVISKNKFPKITKLELLRPDFKLFDSFNITTIRFAKLLTPTYDYGVYDDHKAANKFIEIMINDQVSLEYLGVDIQNTSVNLVNIIQAAEIALLLSKDKQRKTDKLFFDFNRILRKKIEYTEEYVKKLYLAILRFVNSFELTKIANWRLKVGIQKTWDDKESKIMRKWLDEFETSKERYLINYDIEEHAYSKAFKCFTLTISTKDCTICGY